MSEEQSNIPFEEPKGGEKAIEVLRTLLSAVPLVGPAIGLLDLVVVPPLERRKTQWQERLETELEILIQTVEGLTPEALAENEIFITILLNASASAVKNHQKEKLDALRNAVLNAALPDAPDDTLQMIFLKWVDEFTALHLKALSALDDPNEYAEELMDRPYLESLNMFTAPSILRYGLPELFEQHGLESQIVKDLDMRGLLSDHIYMIGTTSAGKRASQTSNLGKQFLEFIASPLKD